MYRIDENNNIFLTRGDTAVLLLSVVDSEGTPYDFSNDTVQLTVKTSVYTDDLVFQKNITNGHFEIEPADTSDLPYGKYFYDVQIVTPNDKVYTVIPPKEFYVLSEVNFDA